MTHDEQWDAVQQSIGRAMNKAIDVWSDNNRRCVGTSEGHAEVHRLQELMWEVRVIRRSGSDVDPLLWKLANG